MQKLCFSYGKGVRLSLRPSHPDIVSKRHNASYGTAKSLLFKLGPYMRN